MTEPEVERSAGAAFGRPADVDAEFETFDDAEFAEAEDDDADTDDDAAAEDDDALEDDLDADEFEEGDDDADTEVDSLSGDDDADDDDDDYDEAAKAKLARALAEIDAQFGKPPADQVAAFAEAQQTLQATLARIDTN